MKLFTIGFTKKSAQTFFSSLAASGARQLVDVRLNNVSQLAGFAKREDLRYFTRTICKIDYTHLQTLAPTQSMLDTYKKYKGPWEIYEGQFLDLMKARKIETMERSTLEDACLLCSEETPHRCHRRLVAEYLRQHWEGVEIRHLP